MWYLFSFSLWLLFLFPRWVSFYFDKTKKDKKKQTECFACVLTVCQLHNGMMIQGKRNKTTPKKKKKDVKIKNTHQHMYKTYSSMLLTVYIQHIVFLKQKIFVKEMFFPISFFFLRQQIQQADISKKIE